MVKLATPASVLMIGPLPPPTGGQSVLVSNILSSNVCNQFPMLVLNIGHGGMGVFQRLLLTGKYFLTLIGLLWRNPGARVVHVHSSAGMPLFEKGLFILIASLWQRRVLLHVHGGRFRDVWARFGIIRRRLTQAILSRCSGVIVLSDDWIPFYRDELGYSGALYSLPNSVRACAIPRAFDSDSVCMLYVGNLKREKGLIDLSEAIAKLPSALAAKLRVRLMGVGDTPENERCVREAFADFAPGQVEFLGLQAGDEKWRTFGEADILVLPSHSEDFPLTILEAMALGLPVISTRVGAIPELISDGQEGRLVSPGNTAELMQAIGELLSSQALRTAMGNAGRIKFCDAYSFERYGEKLAAIYHELSGNGRL